MKTHVVETKCAVCGAKGLATPSAALNEWLGHILVHNDPRICIENLKRKKKQNP